MLYSWHCICIILHCVRLSLYGMVHHYYCTHILYIRTYVWMFRICVFQLHNYMYVWCINNRRTVIMYVYSVCITLHCAHLSTSMNDHATHTWFAILSPPPSLHILQGLIVFLSYGLCHEEVRSCSGCVWPACVSMIPCLLKELVL